MALEIEYVKERHVGRWIFLILVIILLAVGGWFGYKWYTTGDIPVPLPIASANSNVDESDVAFEQIQKYTVASTHPRYISIPSINVPSTRVYPVTLDNNNLLATAANIHDAGWYEKSGTPGDGGVVLMNGHNASINKQGAFARLADLKEGDKITVERGDGQEFTYTVKETQSLPIDEVNVSGMKLMGQPIDPAKEGLNLITFDGKWVPKLGMFDRRILLRAIIDSDN